MSAGIDNYSKPVQKKLENLKFLLYNVGYVHARERAIEARQSTDCDEERQALTAFIEIETRRRGKIPVTVLW